MSNVVITGVDVFAGIDPTRPVASIQRVGAGKYRVRLLTEGGVIDREDHDDYDTALAFAEQIADLVDADPANPAHITVSMHRVAQLQQQLAELKAGAG